MSIQLLVLLLPLVMEDQYFVAATLLDHLPGNKRLRRLAKLALGAAERQHVVELHIFTTRLRHLLDLNHVSGCDAILLPPGADHRVHGNTSINLVARCGANGLNSLCACTSPSVEGDLHGKAGRP